LIVGVEKVGSVVSTFDKDFDYGPNTELTYNARLGKFVHQFPYDVQVRFGDKGDNLTFRNVVDGKVISTAVIEFNRH
jgi:hypothetical protein